MPRTLGALLIVGLALLSVHALGQTIVRSCFRDDGVSALDAAEAAFTDGDFARARACLRTVDQEGPDAEAAQDLDRRLREHLQTGLESDTTDVLRQSPLWEGRDGSGLGSTLLRGDAGWGQVPSSTTPVTWSLVDVTADPAGESDPSEVVESGAETLDTCRDRLGFQEVTVTFALTFGYDGRVETSDIELSTNSPAMVRCVQRELRRWRFDPDRSLDATVILREAAPEP